MKYISLDAREKLVVQEKIKEIANHELFTSVVKRRIEEEFDITIDQRTLVKHISFKSRVRMLEKRKKKHFDGRAFV